MKDIAARAEEQPERRKAREGSAARAMGGWASAVRSWPKQTKSFLGDVRAELRRVSWPTFAQVRATTVVVILTVFFFGAYFGILDWLFTAAVGRLLRLGE